MNIFPTGCKDCNSVFEHPMTIGVVGGVRKCFCPNCKGNNLHSIFPDLPETSMSWKITVEEIKDGEK